jgi:hypothetical protein
MESDPAYKYLRNPLLDGGDDEYTLVDIIRFCEKNTYMHRFEKQYITILSRATDKEIRMLVNNSECSIARLARWRKLSPKLFNRALALVHRTKLIAWIERQYCVYREKDTLHNLSDKKLRTMWAATWSVSP